MISLPRFPVCLVLLAFAAAAAGCNDTWQGLKKDAGENLEKTGEALDRAGEKMRGEEAQE